MRVHEDCSKALVRISLVWHPPELSTFARTPRAKSRLMRFYLPILRSFTSSPRPALVRETTLLQYYYTKYVCYDVLKSSYFYPKFSFASLITIGQIIGLNNNFDSGRNLNLNQARNSLIIILIFDNIIVMIF